MHCPFTISDAVRNFNSRYYSVTIDGSTNAQSILVMKMLPLQILSITIGSGVTISAKWSGINSAPNVLYVAKDGSKIQIMEHQ